MGNHLVLFLGRANAGRTFMAEALVSRSGAPRFRAASTAGLAPGTEVDPGAALTLRAELNSLPSPGLDDFLLRQRAQNVARGPGWSAPTRI